eukprot:COSAG02_NODE_3896_length_6071_cov_8.989953_3_plen_231_part_00
MPFEKKRPRVSGAVAVARSVSAAQKKAGGSPDGKLRKLIDRFEGSEQERPNESKICTFCGATMGGLKRNLGRHIDFVLCRDTDEKAASAHFFPGQSRDTDSKLFALVKNRLSPELTRTYFATAHWSCKTCAKRNERWYKNALDRLRRDADRINALRQVLAVGNEPVTSNVRQARIAALPPPANSVTVEWEPWDGESLGGTHVRRVQGRYHVRTQSMRWEPVPEVSLSRCL